jgi:hypothetical protein
MMNGLTPLEKYYEELVMKGEKVPSKTVLDYDRKAFVDHLEHIRSSH